MTSVLHRHAMYASRSSCLKFHPPPHVQLEGRHPPGPPATFQHRSTEPPAGTAHALPGSVSRLQSTARGSLSHEGENRQRNTWDSAYQRAPRGRVCWGPRTDRFVAAFSTTLPHILRPCESAARIEWVDGWYCTNEALSLVWVGGSFSDTVLSSGAPPAARQGVSAAESSMMLSATRCKWSVKQCP